MTIDGVIGVLWLAFWLYWLVSAVGVKTGRGRSRSFVGVRVAIVLVVVGLSRSGLFGKHAATHGIAPRVTGLVVLVLGLGLAVWARRYLGRNWGMPMTQKLEPELVTSGPYRLIRHPIYTGIIVGMLGTAVAISLYGLIPVALLSGYFVHSARVEERYLTTQFPDSYPRYQASSKMLVPFVL